MTLQEFIDYALNKKQIEYHSYDPRAKFQCVDLANDYIIKVWGLKAIIGTNAKDFPENLSSGMEFVLNTKEYLPEPGEIAVWSEKVGGGAGHIAVVTEKGKQTVFKSLDQNWSVPQQITLESHSYSYVRGFIRKKGSVMSEETSNLDWKGLDPTNLGSLNVAVKVWADVRDGKYMSKDEYTKAQSELDTCNRSKSQIVGERDRLKEIKLELVKLTGKEVEKAEDDVANALNHYYVTERNNEIDLIKQEKVIEAPKKAVTEGAKEPIRIGLSALVGVAVTALYTKYPFLGQIAPDQQVIVVATVGVLTRTLNELVHNYGKSIENDLLKTGFIDVSMISYIKERLIGWVK